MLQSYKELKKIKISKNPPQIPKMDEQLLLALKHLYILKDSETAKTILRNLEESSAYLLLAQIYSNEGNDTEAFRLFHKSAQLGDGISTQYLILLKCC